MLTRPLHDTGSTQPNSSCLGRCRQAAQLQAQQITVEAGGQLSAGTPGVPYPGQITISFSNSSSQLQPEASLLVLGTLSLHGLPRPPAWTLLAGAAAAGDTGSNHGFNHACGDAGPVMDEMQCIS